jgi:UDP-4-amino-4,6-dideoxy-N-acetyl-beta-L-altrosamine transaminase
LWVARLIPYGRQTISWSDAFKVLWQVKFKSLTQGSKIAEYEAQVAKYVGAKYAVAVSSATAGLHLAVLALELPEESEIATSPISFVASSNCILYAGNKPVFLDIDEETVNLSTIQLENRINQNTNLRAVIPVHFSGLTCDMESIFRICHPKGIKIIEDAAHALGSHYKNGGKVGNCQFSDITVFSTHPVKSITTGEGGVITTNEEAIYAKLIRLRSHGINKLQDQIKSKLNGFTNGNLNLWYYEMNSLGFNYRLSEIQSVLGLSQISRIDKFIKSREKIAIYYDEQFRENDLVKPAQKFDRSKSANHIYPVRINFRNLSISRNELMTRLRNLGIITQVHYIPIPMQPYYSDLGYECSDLFQTMNYYNECLTLPIFPKLSKQKQNFIVKEFLGILKDSRKTE